MGYLNSSDWFYIGIIPTISYNIIFIIEFNYKSFSHFVISPSTDVPNLGISQLKLSQIVAATLANVSKSGKTLPFICL